MDESWTPLDRFGWLEARASDEANFLALNEGTERHKKPRYFALCLACGYAQLMPSPAEVDKNQNWWQHHPLGKAPRLKTTREGYCIGNSEGHQYLFQQGISLAAEWKTDCLQLRFSHLDGIFSDLKDTAGANPRARRIKRFTSAGIGIAVALRNAIAKHFGISEDEINFATDLVRERQGKIERERLVVSLFDRSMGGYCSTAADCLTSLFKDANALLHCPKDCPDACSACILQFDTERDDIKLDRHDALAVLEAHGVTRLDSSEIELAGCRTVPLARPFAESLLAMAESTSSGEVTLYVGGSEAGSISPITTQVMSLAESLARYYPRIQTRLAAIGFDWRSLQSEAQNDLHRLCKLNVEFMATKKDKYGKAISLKTNFNRSSENEESAEESIALVAAFRHTGAGESQASACVFALHGSSVEINNRLASWRYEGGDVRMLESVVPSNRLPLLTKAEPPQYQAPVIETLAEKNAVVVRTFSAQGATFLNFGEKVLSAIILSFDKDAENLFDISESSVEKVTYSDRYLERAGDTALVLSIFEAIQSGPCGSDETKYIVRTCVPKSRRNDRRWLPSKLYENWGDENDRQSVFDELSILLAKGAGVQTTPPISVTWEIVDSQQKLRHARTLELQFANGRTLEVFLDQGMGFVKFDESRLDIRTPKEWADWLYRLLSGRVNRRSSLLADASPWPTNISAAWQ